MLSIQEAGTQILGNEPKKFYAFCGVEYGVKKKYIDHIASLYNGRQKECQSVADLIDMMNVKHLIPLQPTVYVVRYDETFISALNAELANKIKSCKIIGTIVCIYEDDKHATKLDKYLPDYTVTIDNVSKQFLQKYLKSDFPELELRFINYIINIASDYNQAHNMCYCLSVLDNHTLDALTEADIIDLFGHSNSSSEAHIQLGVASKNFKYLINAIDDYVDDLDKLYYTILQTMIELDKLLTNPKADSKLKSYAKLWRPEDVYYMFMNTYSQLVKSRTQSIDTYNSLVYLFGLLQFSSIPDPEVMK